MAESGMFVPRQLKKDRAGACRGSKKPAPGAAAERIMCEAGGKLESS